MKVDATLAMITRTSDRDRGDHPAEYRAQMERDLSRLDDDGGLGQACSHTWKHDSSIGALHTLAVDVLAGGSQDPASPMK